MSDAYDGLYDQYECEQDTDERWELEAMQAEAEMNEIEQELE